jgi:uncharacterized protein YjbI with pentapeptide repeats
VIVLAGLGWRWSPIRFAGPKAAKDPWALRYSLPILVVGAVGAAVAFTFAYRSITGADKDRADVGIKAATATAALAAGVLTWGRLELSRREHGLATDRDLTDRYGRAVDQLGNTEQLIRAGGAYALERFALDAYALAGPDNETDWRMAIDMLASFVRHRLADIEPQAPLPVDARAALEALGRFNKRAHTRSVVRYDLQAINLANLDLRESVLIGADLTRATLPEVAFLGADLTDARLIDAKLTRAHLGNANLTRARLWDADLKNADLHGANLTNADLSDADLSDAVLSAAVLIGARLIGTNLIGARLIGTDLNGARLNGAVLNGAHLTEADFTGADFTGADVAGVDFAGATLTDAIGLEW